MSQLLIAPKDSFAVIFFWLILMFQSIFFNLADRNILEVKMMSSFLMTPYLILSAPNKNTVDLFEDFFN